MNFRVANEVDGLSDSIANSVVLAGTANQRVSALVCEGPGVHLSTDHYPPGPRFQSQGSCLPTGKRDLNQSMVEPPARKRSAIGVRAVNNPEPSALMVGR